MSITNPYLTYILQIPGSTCSHHQCNKSNLLAGSASHFIVSVWSPNFISIGMYSNKMCVTARQTDKNELTKLLTLMVELVWRDWKNRFFASSIPNIFDNIPTNLQLSLIIIVENKPYWNRITVSLSIRMSVFFKEVEIFETLWPEHFAVWNICPADPPVGTILRAESAQLNS